jgi:UDP-3-O-[3-hydroxymyristoyl] glucosamine N-acyltransferase
MPVKLSQAIREETVARDGEFETLGRVDSELSGTLAYCDTVVHLTAALANTNVSCIVTTPELALEVGSGKGLVVSSAPRVLFYRIHNRLIIEQRPTMPTAPSIGEACDVHPSAQVSARARIGSRVALGERVVVKEEVEIGDDTFVDAGAVIGVDGLLYVTDEAGNKISIRHGGGVRIGRGVTVLSNVVIARGIHAPAVTRIGDRSIIGIATNVGHEAEIGRNCVVSSNCVVARGAKLDDEAYIGSSAVIREYVRVGRGAQVQAGSIVVKDVAPGRSVSGNFAIDHIKHLREHARMSR